MDGDLQGRRRDDVVFGELPDDVQPGDYWRYVNDHGEPIVAAGSPESGNLTGGVWGFCGPQGGCGTMRLHTVRENPDGTISVLPNDGSSNSIAFTSSGGYWHGFIYDGVWRPA